MTKFDRLMHNDLPMTINRSKSKQEAKFQYGGRPFSETGSSFILAVDWGISSKFGKRMDINLLKRLPLRNLNPEVDFRFYDTSKTAKINFINSGAVDIIRTAYYIRGLELMKLIFAVLDVSLTMGLTRCYKPESFFLHLLCYKTPVFYSWYF